LVGLAEAGEDAVPGHDLKVVLVGSDRQVGGAGESPGQRRAVRNEQVGGGSGKGRSHGRFTFLPGMVLTSKEKRSTGTR
jgi:hypothetical protein